MDDRPDTAAARAAVGAQDAFTIYKYTCPMVNLRNIIEFDMPREVQPISAAAVGQDLAIWAMVKPSRPTETHRFLIAGTGHPLEREYGRRDFLGTCIFLGGMLVFHVVWLGPPVPDA